MGKREINLKKKEYEKRRGKERMKREMEERGIKAGRNKGGRKD